MVLQSFRRQVLRRNGRKVAGKGLWKVWQSFQGRVLALLLPHLGVLEEEEFFAKGVETDAGLEFGDLARDLKNLAGAKAVVLNAHSDMELGHRQRNKVWIGCATRFFFIPINAMLSCK